MKSLKLVGLSFCIMSIFLLLSACSSGSGSDSASKSKANSSNDDKIEIKIAGQYEPGHPESEAIETFKSEVEERTEGRIEVTTYPANQLGDYTQVYEEIMKGTIEMALINVPSSYDPRIEILYLPYLTSGFKKAEDLIKRDSFLYSFLEEVHGDTDVKLLGLSSGGMGGIFTNKEVNEPTNPNVAKGVNVRVPGTDATKFAVEDIGFETTTIAYSDLFTSFQTGLVDGADGLDPMEFYTAFSDVADYYYVYNDYYNITNYLMNDDLWNKLEESDQQIITDVINELTTNSIEIAEKNQKEYIEKIKDAGVEVVEFSESELEEISNHVRTTTWPKVDEDIGKDVIEELIKELE